MVHYNIWVDLKPGVHDLAMIKAAQIYLQGFIEREEMVSYFVNRRTFGFGIEGVGEFYFRLSFENMTQMESALGSAARRSGVVEQQHADLYTKVTNFKAALYRDFPDEVREEKI